MSGDQFHVETDRLRASQEFQSRMALDVSELACRVRAATTTGNAFGVVGSGANTEYQAWVQAEATGLEELTRMLNDLADGLANCADLYDGVDTHTADGMTTLQGKLG